MFILYMYNTGKRNTCTSIWTLITLDRELLISQFYFIFVRISRHDMRGEAFHFFRDSCSSFCKFSVFEDCLWQCSMNIPLKNFPLNRRVACWFFCQNLETSDFYPSVSRHLHLKMWNFSNLLLTLSKEVRRVLDGWEGPSRVDGRAMIAFTWSLNQPFCKKKRQRHRTPGPRSSL